MKNILAILLVAFLATSYGQDAKPKVKTITFKTSAVCGSCQTRIENALNYTKGIIFAELDLETKEVTVKYKTKYLNEKQVKEIVAHTGYDAGDVPRESEAFEKLPKCCKTEGICTD